MLTGSIEDSELFIEEQCVHRCYSAICRDDYIRDNAKTKHFNKAPNTVQDVVSKGPLQYGNYNSL